MPFLFALAIVLFHDVTHAQGIIGRKLLATVPDVKQETDYTCGPSSLKSVLAYYGQKVSEDDLAEETNTDPEVGADLAELIESATARGLKAELKEGATLEMLEAAVDRGQLSIILGQAWRAKRGWFRRHGPWEEEWDAGHYMVVIGYDSENIYFEDPWIAGNRGHIPREEFLTRWHGHSDEGEERHHQVIFLEGTPDLSRRALNLRSIHID